MNLVHKYGWGAVVVLVFVFFVAGCGSNSTDARENRTMTVYSSPNCSCCNRYVDYLKNQGINVEGVKLSSRELSRVKRKQRVPQAARSCHTGVIGKYFVEGHVPVEAIEKLTANQPDLVGISIPGMKRNTPGMGYPIGKSFRVLSVDARGRTEEFTRVQY